MEDFETGGFPDNKNGNLFMQVDCDLVGKIDGKPIVPHASEKLNEAIHKAVKNSNRIR